MEQGEDQGKSPQDTAASQEESEEHPKMPEHPGRDSDSDGDSGEEPES